MEHNHSSLTICSSILLAAEPFVTPLQRDEFELGEEPQPAESINREDAEPTLNVRFSDLCAVFYNAAARQPAERLRLVKVGLLVVVLAKCLYY